MTAHDDMTHCPSDETLAAFIDGMLEGEARSRTVEHLAECGICREMVLMADEVRREGLVPTVAPNVVRGRFGPKWLAPLVAAAAVATVLLGVPSIRERLLGSQDRMAAVVDAAESLPYRPGAARLSADFEYRPSRSATRGAQPGKALGDSATWRIAAVAGELEVDSIETASVQKLHILGVSYLYLEKETEAVETLEMAVRRDSGLEEVGPAVAASRNAALLTDLAGAYLARAERTNSSTDFVAAGEVAQVGSSRVDLQACKLEYSIVSPK